MRNLRRSLVLILFAGWLYAQTSLPRYSALKTESSEAYLASLNQLADQGYRVLAVSKYTVLRLDAAPPNTYRYLRVELEGGLRHPGPSELTNWVNEQGAHGYRWMPRLALLEKAPHPRNYEYRNSPHGAFGPSRSNQLSSMVEQGYRPVGSIAFSHALGSATWEMFFERDLDQSAPAPTPYPGTSIAIADAMRADNVMKHVDDLAQKGYRFVSPQNSYKGGGIAVMMEKCSENCAGRYQYHYFDAKDFAQVERNLNTLGKDGFRVVPAALTSRPHLLERDTHAKQTFSYRALDPADAASLAVALNAADQEGYVPLDFVWHVGFSSAHGFLVLEKETTASAPP